MFFVVVCGLLCVVFVAFVAVAVVYVVHALVMSLQHNMSMAEMRP